MERNRSILFFLGTLTVIAVGVVLKTLKPVVLPLVIAWFLSYVVAPMVDAMVKRKVPRTLALFLVLLFLFAVCYGGFIFLHGRISSFAEAFPRYNDRFIEISRDVGEKLSITPDFLTTVDWGKQVGATLFKLTGSLVSVLSYLVMVIIFLIFLLLAKPYTAVKIKNAFSRENAGKITKMLSSISSQITRYLSIQFLISFATGVFVCIALALIGVDFAVTWGALAFFLNFIPTVGSIIASVPPIVLALVQFYPNIIPGIITFVSILGIQMIIGNGIAPKVMGDTLNLNPTVILLSLLFWGWLWGIVGALLSVPIIAAIKILCEQVDELRPVSIMMGSGKGLT